MTDRDEWIRAVQLYKAMVEAKGQGTIGLRLDNLKPQFSEMPSDFYGRWGKAIAVYSYKKTADTQEPPDYRALYARLLMLANTDEEPTGLSQFEEMEE